MNFKHIMMVLLLSLSASGMVYAAGSPINEDYTALIALGDKMLAASKASDVSTFAIVATEASDVAKVQGNKGNSPRLQRISTKIKQAKKSVKAGDFLQATTLIEEALAEMKKTNAAPQWGGNVPTE
jgi:predicted ATP-grasp superfamily ATP-dependent carboligase